MKFSEQWLREWVDPPLSAGQLAAQLTMAGLEVESISPCTRDFSGVVAGRVQEVLPHPGSKDLQICKVAGGELGMLTVVCGAPLAGVGRCYALAPAGAWLAGGRLVEATAIRGVLSEGMLCSRAELGLGEDAAQLLELDAETPAGTPLEEVLGLNDHIIDLAVTPNRGDCLSIHGVAREVGVLSDTEVKGPEITPAAVVSEQRRLIRLAAPQACPRYLGRVIEEVDAHRTTPVWISERLRRSEVRSINIVVDVSNYVLLELGQPLHAFDNDRLQGEITVRFAAPGEQVNLLDGRQYVLAEDTLVIADATRAIAMAGIMGGVETAVSSASRNLFLESAFFVPEAILGRARRYGLQTDASQRFERGVDPSLPRRGLERATQLILQYCGGRAGPVTEGSSAAHLPPGVRVVLRPERLNRLLGISIDPDQVTRILARLGFIVQPGPAGWEVGVPPCRFDVSLEADLIEEVARIYGYHRIVSRQPEGRARMHGGGPDPRFGAWRRILTDRGYFEAITYSFVDERLQRQLFGTAEGIPLQNPLSADLGVMRLSLWPGLLQALNYNLNRQQQRVRLFEIGRTFERQPELNQEYHLAGVIIGNIYPEQWDKNNISSNLFDIKGDVEAILRHVDRIATPAYQPAVHAACHPGQTAEIFFHNQKVGLIGAIHPRVLEALGIAQPVYAFELNIARIAGKAVPCFAKLSKFPSVRRDIALLVDRETPVAHLMAVVRDSGGEWLTNLELFDVYEGEGIDLGKKSLALGLTFQKSSSTLIDLEVEVVLGRVMAAVKGKFGAQLRD